MQVSSRRKRTFLLLSAYILCTILCVIILFFSNTTSAPLNNGDTQVGSFATLEEKYIKIVMRENPRAAIQLLQIEASADSHISALCHDVLHSIGRAALTKYATFQEAIAFQDPYCNSGYIHGLFESYMQVNQDSFTQLSDLCGDTSSLRAFDAWQCHHGIGHGFMYYTGGELDTSLAYCNEYLEDPSAVESCYNGVYMEVFNQEILNQEASFVDPTDPFSTCASRKVGTYECYMYVPTYFSQTSRMSFLDIFSQCALVSGLNQYACISGVGSEAMKRNMSTPERVFELCSNAGSPADESSCVFGMVSMYLNQEGTVIGGVALCERAPLQYRALCRGIVESQKDFFE